MCRIAGMFSSVMDIKLQQELVSEMCRLQQHGGPDDEGLYSSETDKIVLGNRRLALLDLTAMGHMPMQYEERYWITYNGEIYNFHELKETLTGLGHQFNTHTDTEVIIAAYSRWGVQSFAKLNGMFAFAIWDSYEKELILVRDPAGMKPLYYSREDNAISFASEIRSLRIVPTLKEQNDNWPVYLMAYGHIPEPVTTLSKVNPLPKGCFLKYNTEKKHFILQNFKHFNYYPKIKDEAEAIAAIREQLGKAVSRHMFADAPIGIFLSGGVDSGIVSLLAAKDNPKQVNSLSLFFEETKYSEKKYQDILINQIGCTNKQHLLKRI